MYPDWVEKYHTEGTSVKKVKDFYYLYKVTSKRVKGKKYPVSSQKYIGRITKEGLIKKEKISFTLGVDKIVILSDLVEEIESKDKKVLSKIAVIEIDGNYYCGKLSSCQITIIEKYFDYEASKIIRRKQ